MYKRLTTTVYNNNLNNLNTLPGRNSQEETDVSPLDAQSGTERFNVTINQGSPEVTSQNVSFNDQNPSYTYEVKSEMDETRMTTDSSDADLGAFFSRPLKIASYEWATTEANFFEVIDPWTAYFANPRVINRISNFNLMRAKLHVKIIINGNGFHYGRLLASYNPLHTIDNFSVNRAFFPEDAVQASQLPHVYLDPTTSLGGDLLLPFFWNKNSLSIPKEEWEQMGQITISQLARLKHANGAVDRVTISMFAWAEDVSLSIPTSSEPGGLTPQCGVELLDAQSSDEYGSGPVSAPATAVARAAGALRDAPIIGPYARATEMAASAVSGIARMFGYSRPVILADVLPYRPTTMGNMANTNMPDSATKLSIDCKQELSVDPRIAGLGGTDEMSICSIAGRESYLTQFPWPVDTVTESPLWHTEVTPVTWASLEPSGSAEELHMPACCYAALPFKYWRGTMKYRFQIVSSTFHKGRIKVVYDPHGFASNEYNTNYTQIIDIAETKDFTIDIGWGSEYSYLQHREPGTTDPVFGNGAPTSVPGELANGMLAVYVVNELTVPNSTVDNDITINVFVSAGDDFEVGEPDTGFIADLVWFNPGPNGFGPELLDAQSGTDTWSADAEGIEEASAPMQTSSLATIAESQDKSDNMAHVHFGEHITSFRQCLKRYALHTITPLVLSGPSFYSRRTNDKPFYRGLAPGAIHVASAANEPVPYNYVKTTLQNYLMPAYAGVRGGQRWKYHKMGGCSDFNSYMDVHRITNADIYQEVASAELAGVTRDVNCWEAMAQTRNSWGGITQTSDRVNPVIEVELPYYSNLRFTPAKVANLTTVSDGHFHEFRTLTTPGFTVGGTTAAMPRLAAYNSVGEDFNLFFFTGCPVAYSVLADPTPF